MSTAELRAVVLAYSGGLDTSAAIPWLKEAHPGCRVIAFAGDVGQGAAELEGVEARARAAGADECVVVDLKERLLTAFAYPTLLAGPRYEGVYLLGTAIARPLLAQEQVRVAREFGADAVAHGCTGKGNDQVRFESAFAALAPDLRVVAPWRLWPFRSRSDLLAYLESRGAPMAATATKTYSRDANLLHVSHEGGPLEDPSSAAPEEIWLRTVDPRQAPDEPETLELRFAEGVLRAVEGREAPPVELFQQLDARAAAHGVGRVDMVESRLVGMKSRGCYEAPAMTVLDEALWALRRLVFDRDLLHEQERLALRFAELVYDGKWFTPLRAALQAFAEANARRLTGVARLQLFKGRCQTVAVESPCSVHDHALASFERDDVYDQSHAEGFLRLFTLPQRVEALRQLREGSL